jgi:hypothetical protein
MLEFSLNRRLNAPSPLAFSCVHCAGRREIAMKLGQFAAMKLPAPFLLLGLLAGPALAQAPATGNATVAAVEVQAVPPPAVVATYPAQGATVAPGVLVLKIVFDQHMTADAWSYSKLSDGEDPNCLGTPRLLTDEKTFVLLCTTDPGKAYGVGVNLIPGKAFVDRGGRRPPPVELRFKTSTAEPVNTLKAAMTAAALTDMDMPIESLGAFVRPKAED